MNKYIICWFSQFGFPRVKYLCNVCIAIVSFLFFYWKYVCSKYCTRLKYTFGIEICWLQGGAFVVKGLSRDCDKPCYSGRSMVLIFQVKRNGEQFENEDREVLSCGSSRWKICWWTEISGSRWIHVLHLQELQQITRKSWIGRWRAQSDFVSQIQYY